MSINYTVDKVYTGVSRDRLQLPCVIVETENYSVDKTFDCGQCFRFNKVPSSSYGIEYEGVAFGRYIRVAQDHPNEIIIINTDLSDYEKIWKKYLGLDIDWGAIERHLISRREDDGIMEKAARLAGGIRILRQEPWETLCSFIISQNNNIPRIKKIIESISERLGTPIDCPDGITRYAFPTDRAILMAGIETLMAMNTGYRAKYLYDAARLSVDRKIDFLSIEKTDDLDTCAAILRQIKGVGPKVAACVLLFGFGKLDAFPVDVWIRRSLKRHFSGGLDLSVLSPYAGVAQQYLFYYTRYIEGRD